MLAASAAGERGVAGRSDLRAEPFVVLLLVLGEGEEEGDDLEEKAWWMRCSRRTQLRRVMAMAK